MTPQDAIELDPRPERPRLNQHRRLRSETVAMILEHAGAQHPLDVSLAYDADGALREIVFVGRGKIGQGLDLLLHDLGIKLSRAIQGRNPDTGQGEKVLRP